MARQREGKVVKIKDPNAPKKPTPLKLRAFQNFLREYLETHPKNGNKGHFKILQKEAGALFKALTEDEKMAYSEIQYETETTPMATAAPVAETEVQAPAAKKSKKK